MMKIRKAHWIKCQVQDVAELFRGITYKKEMVSKNPKGGYKLILRANNIKNGKINFDELLYVPVGIIKNEQIICKGDIVFAMSSGSKHLVGKSAQVKDSVDGSFGAFCGLLRPSKHISDKYISYIFQDGEYRKLISKIAKGSNINNLKREHILGYDLWLPPIEEQYRIVEKIEELFSELDKGIESLKTAREQLKVYRQALLKHAFEGKLTEQWRKDNADELETADQLLSRIQQEREMRYQQQLDAWGKAVRKWEAKGKDSRKPSKPNVIKEQMELTEKEITVLPKVPKNYAYTYLAELGNLGRGKSKHRPRNDPILFGGKYPFIQTGEVKAASRVVTTYQQTLSDVGLAQSKLWPKGTLCITIAANIAETAFLGFESCFPDSVVGFTAFDKLIHPKYIEFFIMSVRVRVEAYAPATAQKNINLTTLENLVVPFTSLAEQYEVVNVLDNIIIDTHRISHRIYFYGCLCFINSALTSYSLPYSFILRYVF